MVHCVHTVKQDGVQYLMICDVVYDVLWIASQTANNDFIHAKQFCSVHLCLEVDAPSAYMLMCR